MLVPNYNRSTLQGVGTLIGSDLEATVTERHQLLDALLATRAELSDQVLTVDEFAQLERRRYAIERRLTEVRASSRPSAPARRMSRWSRRSWPCSSTAST